jgi:hypothetical protein
VKSSTKKPYLGLTCSQIMMDQLDEWASAESAQVSTTLGNVKINFSRAEIARSILMKAINTEMNSRSELGMKLAKIASKGLDQPPEDG